MRAVSQSALNSGCHLSLQWNCVFLTTAEFHSPSKRPERRSAGLPGGGLPTLFLTAPGIARLKLHCATKRRRKPRLLGTDDDLFVTSILLAAARVAAGLYGWPRSQKKKSSSREITPVPSYRRAQERDCKIVPTNSPWGLWKPLRGSCIQPRAARLAQLVEQHFCKVKVGSSSLAADTTLPEGFAAADEQVARAIAYCAHGFGHHSLSVPGIHQRQPPPGLRAAA